MTRIYQVVEKTTNEMAGGSRFRGAVIIASIVIAVLAISIAAVVLEHGL